MGYNCVSWNSKCPPRHRRQIFLKNNKLYNLNVIASIEKSLNYNISFKVNYVKKICTKEQN